MSRRFFSPARLARAPTDRPKAGADDQGQRGIRDGRDGRRVELAPEPAAGEYCACHPTPQALRMEAL